MADDETRDEPGQSPRSDEDVPLVARARAGDADAFGPLYDRWFDHAFDLAYRILWNNVAAADVARDAFVSAWRNLDQLDDQQSFGAWLLRLTRDEALVRVRDDRDARPVDAEQLTMTERNAGPAEDRIGALDDPARVAQDASYVALLWDAAEALGERDRAVLDLHLRHGLAPEQIRNAIGSNSDADQLVERVRIRLGTAIGARILWRGGEPTCAALRAELVEADVDRFDNDAVHVIDRHAGACDQCNERRRCKLTPAQMFSVIPILSMSALRTHTAQALAAEGVPMYGSLAFDATRVEAAPRNKDGSGTRPRRVALILAGAVGFLLIVLFALVIRALYDDEPATVAISDTTSTTRRPPRSTTRPSTSTTSTSTSTTTTSTSTTTTTVAAVVPPVTTPPTTATPATEPPRVTVQFTLEPDEVEAGYPKTTDDGPVLRWTVRNAARVHVFDDVDVLDAYDAEGREVVCPATGDDETCAAPPGTYVYTLDAFDAQGQRVLHRTLTLTIT
jgi:RNA polymerase sigma factor (sigma-70 family)